MKQVVLLAPLVLIGSIASPALILAANQPGDYSFTVGIGESGTKNNNTYSTDQTISFALLYQKSGAGAYRAMAGLMSMTGREEISPSVGTRDASAFYMTGDVLWTPRFRVLNPFLGAGIGFYDVRLTDNKDTNNGVELGLNWCIGLDVQLLRWFAIHGEIGYHYLTGSVPNPVQTIVVGGRFDF